MVYAFVCLSAWYVARSLPIKTTGTARILFTGLVSSTLSSAVWLAVAGYWLSVLVARGWLPESARGGGYKSLFFGFGVLLYLLALAVGYLLVLFEESRATDRRTLEVQVLAREAELRSLRSQLDPHFLFNCLHSISALTTADPAAARRMCLLLAEFLRETLALGSESRITVARELKLVDRFLAVERIRFGDRLDVDLAADASAATCLVPPLLLQPLVENAVTHGIAHLLERGTIRIAASRTPARLSIVVENPCDPDRPRGTGAGVGVSNVREAPGGALRRRGDRQQQRAGRRLAYGTVVSCRAARQRRGESDGAGMTETESLRVVIVDDEPLARAVVREYLGAHPGVAIVAECGNGFDAVKAVTELAPDLVFLDVQMPKLDGFEVLELLGRAVPVIFTTAYDKYALRAFDVHAVDYLLKPFSEERLAEALTRARGRIANRDGEETGAPGAGLDVDALVAAARPRQGPLERVLIRDGAQVHVIPADRIDYVEAQDDYVSFVADGRSFLKDQTMAAVEASLDPARFVRIHRSYLLNIERIARVELYAKDSRIAILRDGRKLPVSRAGYQRLAKLL